MGNTIFIKLRNVIITLIVILIILVIYTSSKLDNETETKSSSEVTTNEYNNRVGLKIATYNVGYFSSLQNVAGDPQAKGLTIEEYETSYSSVIEALKMEEIDILSIQEIDKDSKRSYKENQIEILSGGLEIPFFNFKSNWNKKFVPHPLTSPSKWLGGINSLQGILSKYEIVKNQYTLLPKPDNFFLYNLYYFDRYIQEALIDVDGEEILIITLHLEAFDIDTNKMQLEILKEIYLKNKDILPTIILGDFNTDLFIDSDFDPLSYITVDTDLSIAMDDNEPNYTFPSDNPNKAIDHILYDSNYFELIDIYVIDNLLSSDHLPLIAQIRFIER